MEKGLLVFVVFAIVTQSSVLVSSATFDEFSQKDYDLLDQLQSADLPARAKAFDGLSAFVNLLKNGTGQTSSDQDFLPFVNASSVVAGSTEIMYDSALLVSRGDCDGFDAALNETRSQLTAGTEKVISSIALAQGGNYDKNRPEIENNRNLTGTELVNAYATLFDFLRCCISDSSDEFEDLIGEVQAIINENIHLRINAIYEAIEAYSILTSEGITEDEAAAALASIDRNLLIAIIAATDSIENIFALYETNYIYNYLNGSHIVHRLFDIRLARKRTSDKLEETMEVIFLAIKERLLARTSHHEIESNNTTLDDPSQAIAVGLIQDAEEYFLEVVSLTLPNSTDNVTVAKIILPNVLRTVIGHYYEGMDLAEAGLPENVTLSAIKSLEEIQTLVTNFVVAECFEIIGSEADNEAKLEKLQNRVMVSLQEASDAAFDAIGVLFKVAHANEEASQDDLDEVHSYLSTAISAVSDAAKVQLQAVLYKYLFGSGY